jgi:hypothetical protein
MRRLSSPRVTTIHRLGRVAGPLLTAVTLLASVRPAGAVICGVDPVPSATLLLPFFELDLANPNGLTTLFSIDNSTSSAVLTQVTIWSDLAVPILSFNVYLTGYDAQTINLRDVLVYGNLPQTASAGQDESGAISPGPQAQQTNFATCDNFLPPQALPQTLLQHAQFALTGRPSPVLAGKCAGQSLGDNIARGYVTVDTVNSCSSDPPGAANYFGPSSVGKATDQNALWGNWYIVDVPASYVVGSTMVGIEADAKSAATTTAGNYTFYGRYDQWSAADHREPLATNFAAQYFNTSGSGLFQGGTAMIVWRDPKGAQQPFDCPAAFNQQPEWYPLGMQGLVIFDESEHVAVQQVIPVCPQPPIVQLNPFPAATQLVQVNGPNLPVPFYFGWMFLNLNVAAPYNPAPPVDLVAAQAYVVSAHLANGHGVAIDAFRLDSACNPSHFVP